MTFYCKNNNIDNQTFNAQQVYFFTGDYCKRDTCDRFLDNFSAFQFGSSLTFNPVKTEDGRIWRASFGMTYTQFADFYGLYGLSLRAMAVSW